MITGPAKPQTSKPRKLSCTSEAITNQPVQSHNDEY
jgi:hypothetical protein